MPVARHSQFALLSNEESDAGKADVEEEKNRMAASMRKREPKCCILMFFLSVKRDLWILFLIAQFESVVKYEGLETVDVWSLELISRRERLLLSTANDAFVTQITVKISDAQEGV